MQAKRYITGLLLGAVATTLAVVLVGSASGGPKWSGRAKMTAVPAGIHKIKHVIVIMQENRSFDSFFGTFPGADGIPGLAGNPGPEPCVPDPRTRGCQHPYHDGSLVNGGASHEHPQALADIDGGKMDGFIKAAEDGARGCGAGAQSAPPCLQSSPPDVMGYHDAREIPNYWAYAENFTLDDHMFEPVTSWSLPAHMYMVSDWAATCNDSNP
jgi:phospholipase C